MSIPASLAGLRIAYPRADFPPETAQLYARMLADMPEGLVALAVERLIKRSAFLPSVAEIRLEVSEARVALPTVEQAWEIATRGDLRNAPAQVRAACEAAGGRWNLIHSESPEVVRAQFTKDYAARRARAILIDAGAAVQHDNVIELLPARSAERMLETARELDPTERLSPRPVLLRLMRRNAGRDLDLPTAAEVEDARRVLDEFPRQGDPLAEEARRILGEADAA